MNQYHFRSAPWIYTPNVLRYARTAYKTGTKKDKSWALEVIRQWDGAPEEVYMQILVCTDKEFDAMVDEKEGTVTVTI